MIWVYYKPTHHLKFPFIISIMVSQNSPPNPGSSNILHQFINSGSITSQPHFQYHHFNDAYNNNPHHSLAFFPGERISRPIDLVQDPPNSAQDEPEISHTRHLMDLLGAAANETNRQARGLSLSLSTHMPFPSSVDYNRQRTCSNSDLITSNYLTEQQLSEEYSYLAGAFVAASSSSSSSSSFSTVLCNSKYLKPAQSLLEEVVNLGVKAADINDEIMYSGSSRREARSLSAELKAELCNNEFLSGEKHEHQLRISKLIDLLEEVDGRYEKYCHQMEEVVSSFEVIAGLGAAKSYTALALEAMSRHFSSLRDAIVSHIKVEKRKLLHGLPKINSRLSRLSLFDRETRNSRTALQRLGLIQSPGQVWRPIRGLPETSVTILRSWLFEHFLHPYPNDSEKLMLASQTGLSKNQVSNWFINARVRLWKPMIEEMYKEEFGESSEDSNLLASGSLIGEGFTDHGE